MLFENGAAGLSLLRGALGEREGAFEFVKPALRRAGKLGTRQPAFGGRVNTRGGLGLGRIVEERPHSLGKLERPEAGPEDLRHTSPGGLGSHGLM
jgi:hypothetical protein